MFRLLTFGGLSLVNGGVAAGNVMRRSHLALLARIGVAGVGVPRDHLLALFWPDSDEARARGSLKQAIYALRREFHNSDVIVGTDELRLNPTIITSDVADFETAMHDGELARAVELYRGPFLDAVHIGNGEFSRWRDIEAERLANRYRDAVATLAQSAESRDELAGAVSWWRLLAIADPLSASATMHLMRALVRSGDGNAALKSGRAYAARVRTELEVEPDAQVLKLSAELERTVQVAAKHPSAPVDHPAIPDPALDAGVTSRANRTVPNRRRSRILALVGGVALAAVGAVEFGRTDNNAVKIVHSTQWSFDSTLAGRLPALLAKDDPQLTVTTARWSRARFLATVNTRTERDSLHVVMNVVDRELEVKGVIGPVLTPVASADAAAAILAERLGVMLAARRNPLLASWAHVAAMPETWASYHELVRGIESWTDPGSVEPIAHFDSAASLDRSSATPLVWKALMLAKQRRPERDSILRQLESSGRREGPWDRAMVEVLRAWNRGDLTTGHLAGHRLLEIVPGSEWAIVPAYDAMALGRAREALDLVKMVPKTFGWTSSWALIVEGTALHLSGDYATQARVAREAFAREPDRSLARQFLVAALAGLGRVADVEQLCVESMQMAHPQGFPAQPCGQAMSELWGHGHREAALGLARKFAAMIDVEPLSAEAKAIEQAWAFAGVGRWEEAAEALARVRDPAYQTSEYFRYLAWTQAARRDRAGLATTRARLGAVGKDPMFEACIAALLGEKDAAVMWIVRSLREGLRWRTVLHWHAAFEPLHGYPPFEALRRVRDDAEHRERYAQAR